MTCVAKSVTTRKNKAPEFTSPLLCNALEKGQNGIFRSTTLIESDVGPQNGANALVQSNEGE